MDDPTRPGSVNDISESNVTSSDLTRRSLLQGAAATPVLLSGAAWAAEPIGYDLALSLSQNERVLTVTERRIFVNHEKADNPEWIVRAILFGPKAWFSLIKPTSENRRILKVFNCKYGGHGGELTFVFTRDNDKSPWFIDLATNVWNGSGAGKVSFAGFAGANKKLKITRVTSSQADAALHRIFQNHVRFGRHAASTCDVTFDNQLQWKISATRPRTFSLFGGQAWLKEFAFGWRIDQEAITDQTAAGDVFLQGQGSVRTDGFDDARIVIGAGHCVNLALQNKDSPREFEVRTGSSPLDPAVEQIISRLRLGESRITVTDGYDTKAGSISCRDLVLSQTVLPRTGSLRTVLFGSAGLAVDPVGAATSPGEEIATPIGRLTVAALPPDQAVGIAEAQRPVAESAPKGDQAARQKRDQAAARKRERELFFRAACGDRGGARWATLWVVDDVRSGRPANTIRRLRRIAMDLQLRAANAALRDVSFSSLTFPDQGSDLRLEFEDGSPLTELGTAGEFPRARPSSFVWIGHNETKLLGEIDLSRATLTAARDYDLVKLRFRFFDFVLAFVPLPVIRPARADCRLIQTRDGQFEDNRPVLVAEFDPQHVFEEAVFRLEPPSLPDAESNDTRETILAQLDILRNDLAKRVAYRKEVSERKTKAESEAHLDPADRVFAAFSKIYAARAKAAGLPEDQQIYVGPYALDPDAMHLARAVFKSELLAAITKVVSSTFVRVTEIIPTLKTASDPQSSTGPKAGPAKAPKHFFDIDASTDMARNLGNALRNEQTFEQLEPVYAAFRSFYREERSRSAEVLSSQPNPDKPLKPAQQHLWLTEYLSEGNRPKLPSDPDKVDYPTDQKRKEWFDQVFPVFMTRVVGSDSIDDLMAGRLSGPSRLAFRVNCAPPSNATSLEAGLGESSGAGPSAPGGGDFAYKPIQFTFEALTDWSRHEPAVTRRAQKLFTAMPWGVVPPLGERAASLGDHDILAFQGFTKGFITAEQRLGEIRSSMARKPTAFETAIEIPSRLILSTAQDAIWQTVRHLPASAAELNNRIRPPKEPRDPFLESGLHRQVAGDTSVHQAGLWTARLAVEDVNPGLRIVDTPDFRPMVLAPQTAGSAAPSAKSSAAIRMPSGSWRRTGRLAPAASMSGISS